MILLANRMWAVLSVLCLHVGLMLSAPSSNGKYRTLDGSGNNKRNVNWGAFGQPFRRSLPADYCGANAAPRCQKDGTPLPSAREISHVLLQTKRRGGEPFDSRKMTTLHMAMGQFIAHDAGLSKPPTMATTQSCENTRTPQSSPPPAASECFHIEVEEGDPVYNTDTHPVLNFVRDQRENNEQINLQTSWFDLSLVYGSTKDLSDRLLEDAAKSAKLKLRPPPNVKCACIHKDILPKCPDDSCEFDAGDTRVPEQVQLTAIHTIFAREHNRIVEGLSARHADWSVKKLFEEARKINIAQYQHIVYNEYLPPLLGIRLTAGATIKNNGFSTDYNAQVDATTTNEFMSASFRFGHSQIQSNLDLADKSYTKLRTINFDEIFFNTTLILEGKLDQVVLGAILQDAEKSDGVFNKLITSKFKVKDGEILGEDLVALDIQRSRDHGIPGYNDWRRHCNLLPVAFRGRLRKFKAVYKGDADDIDLFVGAMTESPVRGGLVGETFACLLAEDFEAFRVGDRFWYERPGMFNKKQLAEIRKASLARVLCDNLDDMESVQDRPMEQARIRDRRPCSSFDVVDLEKW